MPKNFAFFFFVLFLFAGTEICVAQNANTIVPLENMPAFVKELQQPLPSPEMMRYDTKMYKQILKRRQQLSLLLINEVKQHKLPESALQFLQPQHVIENNIVAANPFTNKTSERKKKAWRS